MAASTLKSLLLFALVLQAAPAATVQLQQQTILLDAQSFEGDLKTNNLTYKKVRISQGDMSITADQAQTTGLDFEDSHWVFRGNVKILVDQGQLTSDAAEVTFAKKLISKAIANGNPAQFEQRMAKTGKLAQGRADSIDYEVASGVVHLKGNAWLSDGQNEIRNDSLKYNLVAQTIVADGSEQGSQRVHIIITPPAKPKP
jgi:lipopolysaccharide transport protein LptA